MKLIFGGAYQGKRAYVEQMLGVKAGEIYNCERAAVKGEDCSLQDDPCSFLPDFQKKAIAGLEEFVWNCLQIQQDPVEELKARQELWQDKIFICTDISSGIVPLQADERAWREMTGRVMIYLAQEAEEVIRIFCGLPQRIKG